MKRIIFMLFCSMLYSMFSIAQVTTTTTQPRSTTRIFDVVGKDNEGKPAYFKSLERNKMVNLPGLNYTIKRSGNYLVILSVHGAGTQEKNEIYNKADNRNDYEGEIRLSPSNNPGPTYITKKFFYTHFDANGDPTQDVTEPIHSDDGEKSLIRYFNQGESLTVNAYVQQKTGKLAPEQKLPWYAYIQVKYILLD